MPDQQDYREKIRGIDPGTAGFSRTGGGRATMIQFLGACGGDSVALTSVAQLHAAIDEILGYAKVHTDGKRINRKLPKAHPRHPDLYAERVSYRGIGRMTKADSDPGQVLEADAFDEMAFYPGYELTIEFASLPYALLTDDQITTGNVSGSLVDKYGNAYSSTAYAEEWLRFTDIDRTPATEVITAEAGQFIFDVTGSAEPHGREAGKGQIKQYIPKSGIVITWYNIPYSFVDGFNASGTRVENYIEQALGCVNQTDWYGFDAGTLLLSGVKITRFPPPRQELKLWQGSTAIYAGVKCCDISFLMLRQKVTITTAGNAAVNTNVIRAGHNLFSWAHEGNSWYFAKTNFPSVAAADGRAAFPSIPFQFLFTNPGVTF